MFDQDIPPEISGLTTDIVAAGLPDPLVYVGSFSDWSASGMPIVAGSEPEGAIVERRVQPLQLLLALRRGPDGLADPPRGRRVAGLLPLRVLLPLRMVEYSSSRQRGSHRCFSPPVIRLG